MPIDLVIQNVHLDFLHTNLFRSDGKEYAAYVLFGISHIKRDPFSQKPRLRLLVKEVLMVNDDEIKSSDQSHISWSTKRFVKLLARAERENFTLGIVHSHPKGPDHFSIQDDKNEAELVQLAQNRNGKGTMLPSLLFSNGRFVSGRVWKSPKTKINIEYARSTGNHWQIFIFHKKLLHKSKELGRQELALGTEFSKIMGYLRFGVVGAGGTGSPLIHQIARMGARKIAIFDPDRIEYSNLNRLYGATNTDADTSKLKVEIMKREIERMGFDTSVVAIDSWVGSKECRDTIKSMDIIFGCTDDHEGRLLLNRLAYYYMIPVIDLGLAMRVSNRHGTSFLESEGRVTVLEPGSKCLICRRIVNTALAAEESLKRNDPTEYEKRKSEAYVRGENNPAPAVISFTTSVATMAIEELIQRLNQFRGENMSIANRVRKFSSAEDYRPGTKESSCNICSSNIIHGAGDIEPFLGRVG